jgi:hypothetical protein
MARPLTIAFATGEGSEPSSAKPSGALTAGWAIIRARRPGAARSARRRGDPCLGGGGSGRKASKRGPFGL